MEGEEREGKGMGMGMGKKKICYLCIDVEKGIGVSPPCGF